MKKLFIAILTLINIAAAAAMLMVLTAGIVSPARFVWLAFAALAFPVFAALNICFSVFWIICRKWLFLISLAALALCYKPLMATFPVHFNKKEISGKKSFTIVSYNVNAYRWLAKHSKKNPNNIIKFLLDSDADIICLQEFGVSRNRQFITENDFLNIFSQYPYHHIQYQNNNYDRSGVATISKFPIVNKQHIDYHSGGNLSIFSDIIIYGDTVRLINNHLESNIVSSVTIHQKSSADEIEQNAKKITRALHHTYPIRARQADAVAKVVKTSPYKTLVCGDFNDVPASYAYNKIKGNLSDAFTETGCGFGWTYSSSIYRVRIDYVLHSADFEAEKFTVGNKKYSDHYPVTCRLSIK